jgi:hypothetical protein
VIGHGWALFVSVAPAAADDDPFAMFGGWDSSQLVWLVILVPIAVVVFMVGSRRTRTQLGRTSPRSSLGGGLLRDEAWRAAVERLEARAPTPIASASDGLVRIEGVITRAMGNLGGAPGRECVWRNRAGAGPQTAVASELLIVADATGCCGVESPELARVIAPVDKAGAHYESTSLYVGDRVEVIGHFTREATGEHEDPTQQVHGTLGGDGRLDIRMLERPAAAGTEGDTREGVRAEASEPSPASTSVAGAPADASPASDPPRSPDAPEHEP